MPDYRIVLGMVVLVLSGQCFAEKITREGAEGLMAQCDQERFEHIQIDKAEAIAECIEKPKNSKEYCDRYFKDYGSVNAGGTIRGMYWGLPLCEKAVEVEKYFRMNPRSNVYDFN